MDLKFLDFEQPIAELEAKIDELRFVGDDKEININPGTYDYDAYNDLFFMTANNTLDVGGNDEYFMVYQGKDTTNSALLYLQTVKC